MIWPFKRRTSLSVDRNNDAARHRAPRRWDRLLVVGLLLAAAIVMLSQKILDRTADPVVGQVAESEVFAPRGFVYHDWPAARERVRAAFSKLPQPYTYDASGFEEGVRRLKAYFSDDAKDSHVADLVISNGARRARTWRRIEILIEHARRDGLLDKSFSEERTLAIIDRNGRATPMLSSAVLQPGAWNDAMEGLEEDEALRVAGLLDRYLPPTLKFDERRASKMFSELESRVRPEVIVFAPERPVIAMGQELDAHHVDLLRQLNLFLARRNELMMTALVLFLVLVLVFGFLFLKYHQAATYDRLRDVAAISFAFGSVLLVCLVVEDVASRLTLGDITLSNAALPVASCAVLLALLYDVRVALIFPVLLSVVVGSVVAPRPGLLVLYLFGSLAATLSAPAARRRSDLLRAGLIIAVTQAVTVVLVGVLGGEPFQAMRADILSALISGLMAAVVAQVLLLPLEAISHRTSAFTLLELADLNHPLLTALLRKSPGTFQHSQHVALLASTAAEAIGANSLLARVGAYYHDIGKMAKPEYFTENQAANENPHDRLKSSLSASVIRSHVLEGLKMAEEERLPEAVTAFIAQHHGTSVMNIFYHRALEAAGDAADINRADFQYPGPKPQTPETGIMMLADAVEAATRSLGSQSVAKIEKLVQRIIADIFENGELDECELTLKDLNVIAREFIHVLCGIGHTRRVEYPDADEIAEAERRK